VYGGGLGFLICLATSLCGVTSWWWLLWGSLIGGVFEVAGRLGCGEELGDIISSLADLADCFSNIDIGDFGGGDGGGGD
jgi:hypothetical protein